MLTAANDLARYMVSNGFVKRSRFLKIPENALETSESAKLKIEDEVQDILNDSRSRVRKILNEQKLARYAIANALMEKESLDRKELESIYKNPNPTVSLKSKKTKRKN
jgi:ATP-dependent Zn protease